MTLLCRVFASSLFLAFWAAASWAEPNCSNVPDDTSYYSFKTACFKHDVCYSEHPLTGFTKKQCDEMFFENMKASCRGALLCKSAATIYYQAVHNASDSSFKSAGKKGTTSLNLIKAKNDRPTLQLMKERARNQAAWVQKNRACSKIANTSDYKRCLDQLARIKVPDIPFAYHLGKCNMFGIDWITGHRTANATKMAKATGTARDQIMDKSKDPCAGMY